MATSYVSWEDLESSFVMKFNLGDPKDCVYVVSVGNITDPLFVVLDYGNDGLNYFCTRVSNIVRFFSYNPLPASMEPLYHQAIEPLYRLLLAIVQKSPLYHQSRPIETMYHHSSVSCHCAFMHNISII